MYNSTIIKKKKKCSSCGKVDYIFSRGRCQQCAKVEDTQKRIDAYEDDDDIESFNNLRDDCDTYMSQMVRLRDSDEKGIATCFTCGARAPWRQMQCGHFVPRRDYGTRWHYLNCHTQCKHCNEVLRGNEEVYAEKLEELHPGSVEMLREMAREVVKPSREELKALIAELRYKVKLFELKLKK
jgi:hypothetical protein